MTRDLLMVPIAWLGALWLHFFPGAIPEPYWKHALLLLPAVIAVHAASFSYCGLYLGGARRAAVTKILRISKAVVLAVVGCILLVVITVAEWRLVPRIIFLLHALLMLSLLAVPRFLYPWARHCVLYCGAAARALIGNAVSAGETRIQTGPLTPVANDGNGLYGTLIDWLGRPRSRLWLYATSMVIAVVYFLSVFDPAFVLGTSDYWATVHGDRIQNLIGYFFYVQDQWRLPLFFTQSLNYPAGANIVYTDSIPALALLAKLFHPVLPAGFHYFGLWFALCYVLQAVAMTVLLSAVGLRTAAAAVSGTLLVLAVPAFLERFGHAALCGHFTIILSLALYLRTVGDAVTPRSAMLLFGLLMGVALLVHVYLFVMVFAVFAAALLQKVLDSRLQARVALYHLGGALAWILSLMLLAGHISPGAVPVSAEGFGYYSMNLLSPVLPPNLPGLRQAGIIRDATGGQYEGENYLGLGLLALLFLHLFLSRPLLTGIIRRHVALFLILVGLTGFAVSNTVYLGSIKVIDYVHIHSPIDWAIGQFRSSGRFFWPVTYVLTATMMILTVRRFRPAIACPVLAMAAILQFVDTMPQRLGLAATAESAEPSLLDTGAWDSLVSRHERILVFPVWYCAATEKARTVNLELQRIAAIHNVPINSVYIARWTGDCVKPEVVKPSSNPRRLYVILDDPNAPTADELSLAKDPLCRRFREGYACTAAWAELRDASVLHGFSVGSSTPSLQGRDRR